MSDGKFLSVAFEAAAKGKDVCIRMRGKDFKRLAIALQDQRNGSSSLMELLKNVSIEIIPQKSEVGDDSSSKEPHFIA